MKKLLLITLISLSACNTPPAEKEYDVLVRGEGIEFTLKVKSTNEVNIRRDARSLLIESGYDVVLAGQLKYTLIK